RHSSERRARCPSMSTPIRCNTSTPEWICDGTIRCSVRLQPDRETSDCGWLHEIKYDGYRIGCIIDKKGVRLISRNGKDWTHVFPSIAEAAQKLKTKDAIIDGEVAMVMEDGRTSFAALQQAAAGTASHTPLV